MDSQAKRRAAHDMHVKFREFYQGYSVLVKDLGKEDPWWPGSVAERSGPRTYVVVLNDGRVWKRHVDHLTRDSMERAVTDPSREMAGADPGFFSGGGAPLRNDVTDSELKSF